MIPKEEAYRKAVIADLALLLGSFVPDKDHPTTDFSVFNWQAQEILGWLDSIHYREGKPFAPFLDGAREKDNMDVVQDA